MPLTLETEPTVRVDALGQPGSAHAFRAAFDFLQRHAEGRYSDRTLMAVNRYSAEAEHVENGNRPASAPSPVVFSLATEVTYDELTEVKQGGTRSMVVAIPTGEMAAKLVIATADTARRCGAAAELVEQARNVFPNASAWVGNNNIGGQKFLLHTGMFPVSMNSRNAIQFAFRDPGEDDGVAR